MTRLEEIIITTRRSGNTTWIVESAVENPNCIIVSRNMQQAKRLEKKYKDLIKKKSWYKKTIWKLFGRKKPKFVSLNYDFSIDDVPVIFDSGALINN
jgi:hypothetical protein